MLHTFPNVIDNCELNFLKSVNWGPESEIIHIRELFFIALRRVSQTARMHTSLPALQTTETHRISVGKQLKRTHRNWR